MVSSHVFASFKAKAYINECAFCLKLSKREQGTA
jgi:hypothetical protein